MKYPRFITPHILEALKESPVVYLSGARQTGKTTLVRQIAEKDHPAAYRSLDDLTVQGAARSDPHGFISFIKEPLVIDEIQLVPELLSAIKLAVDNDRQPGRFLITGSANVLNLPRVSESLAGRMEIFQLQPLSQGELENKQEDFIDFIFNRQVHLSRRTGRARLSPWKRVVTGGYPEIHQRFSVSRKEAWFRNYVNTILQRDIRQLANIDGLTQMPRLLEILSARLGSQLNYAELSRTLQIPQTSLKRYIALFELTFLIQRLLPWSGNLGKRLVKSPKIYFTDTGLASYLCGAEIDNNGTGEMSKRPLMENFVLSELVKQAAWSRVKPRFFHFRSQTGQEVDFILEDRKGNCVCIEVKASATVRPDDFKGLKWLAGHLGKRFIRGLVLYTGENYVPFGDRFVAYPLEIMWNT